RRPPPRRPTPWPRTLPACRADSARTRSASSWRLVVNEQQVAVVVGRARFMKADVALRALVDAIAKSQERTHQLTRRHDARQIEVSDLHNDPRVELVNCSLSSSQHMHLCRLNVDLDDINARQGKCADQ